MKHEKRRLSQSQKNKRAAFLRKVITALLTASIVLFLAVFFAFVPFRLMLPAYHVDAREEGALRLHFLGLAGGVTIVEFPNGEVLVVNAGDSSFTNDNTLCRYLRALDITSLSVLASNADASHIGGMPALFEAFKVDKAYLPAFSSTAGAYERFVSAMDREGCEKVKLVRYGVIENEAGAYAVCLSPRTQDLEDETDDDKSTVLYLSYAGVNIVLSGDMTQKRESLLTDEYELSIFDRGKYPVKLDETHILLASSHGSNNGSSDKWLSLLKPSSTVVCCNEKESPSQSAIERIVKHSGEVLRTDELGAIMITVKDGEYKTTSHVID